MKKVDFILTILICLFCVLLSTTMSLVKAEDPIDVSITLNVGFESQNVMEKSYRYDENNEKVFHEYWNYVEQIKNFYINNEIEEINEYAYKFDVSEEDNGRVVAYLVTNQGDSNYYDLYLQADGIIYSNTDSSYYFMKMINLEYLDNLSGIDTSNVTDMSAMFAYAGYSSEIFTLDVSGWNTGNVENMRGMFNQTGFNSKKFELDVSSFDTSNVTDMSNMFVAVGKNNPNFTLDVSNFDTSKVTNMKSMFQHVGYSSEAITLDLSNFDTSNVTDMSKMFADTGRKNQNFKLNISSFDTSNVTDMGWMFANTGSDSTIFTLDVSNFDTSKVTNMSNMFSCTGYNSEFITLDLSNFDTSKVTDMSWMFGYIGYNNPNFTLDVSSFDTRNVINMGDMFRYAGHNSENFTLDVSNFDTSKVTNMSYMFADTGYNSTIFNIDLSGFDTSNVTNMEAMFYNTGINSTELDTSITIKNPNTIYGLMFVNSVSKEGSKIRVNYTKDTEELVAKVIATKSSNSNVVKGNLIVDVDNLAIGDEIHISGEKFNIISQTDDTITMLAQYNLGPDYKQSTTNNYLKFADSKGWEYTPGPKEIDIQQYDGNAKTYVNEYVEYLRVELGDDSVTGDLITLTELKGLGCTINDDYSYTSGLTCKNSPYKSWLINNKHWWTRSALSTNGYDIWYANNNGELNYGGYDFASYGVRSVITISKEALRNFG